MSQLLAAVSPAFLRGLSHCGQTPLHCALESRDNESVVTMLLDADCEATRAIDDRGNTTLHIAIASDYGEPLIARLFRLYPEAVRIVNCNFFTPFNLAVQKRRAVELLQWSVSFAELVATFANFSTTDFKIWDWQPMMDKQCDLLLRLLNQDVKGIVFEYIGFCEEWVR